MSKVSKLLFSCVLLGSTIGTVQAETQYVTENLNTYLRRGAGDQFKIAGAIQSGEAVTVLEQQGKYTLIRDNKNRDLEAMLDANKREIAIQWFIYGGSVLGVGLLIGLVLPHILPRRKRRDSW